MEICTQCGANIEIDNLEAGVCPHCGSAYGVKKAIDSYNAANDSKRSYEAHNSTTESSADELKNVYESARTAKNNHDDDSAQKLYEQIVIKKPFDWEANFYAVYYRCLNCKTAEIQTTAVSLIDCEKLVLKLIKDNVKSAEAQKQAVAEISAKLIAISRMLFNVAKNRYYGRNYKIRHKYAHEYLCDCLAARDILYNHGDYIIQFFDDAYKKDIALPCWKVGVEQHVTLLPKITDKKVAVNVINQYVLKIKQYDSTYQPPDLDAESGCYIATCVYGSYDCPQVWTLRRYRDYWLAKTWYGRVFIRAYYALSPTIVKWFGKTRWFKKLWKNRLDKTVKKLNVRGVQNTPYEDIKW